MMATKAFAQSGQVQTGVNNVKPSNVGTTTLEGYITIVINVLLGLIGVVAVIMLIIGGFRYVLSQGDEKATKGAKDTILFAIIGIVVAILAFAIVNFVIGAIGGTSSV
jgi:TRAP-type C4-dicarboxylate transport system permease small subunit